VALVGDQPGRVAARGDHRAAGKIEWETGGKDLAFFHLCNAFQSFVRGQQIKPAELSVGAPIAPGGSGWAALPARVLGHGQSTLTSFCRLRRPGGSCSPFARTRRPQFVKETSPT